MVDRPVSRGVEIEDGPNGGGHDDDTKRLGVVHSETQSKVLKDPIGFNLTQSTISLEFVTKNPLVVDHIGGRGT